MNPQKIFTKADYLYTPLFCEENIWQLLLSLSAKIATNKMWALIITNPDKKIALLNQQAAPENQPVIWDYHVILLADINHKMLIFDFDSRLPFVSPLEEYLKNSFIAPDRLLPEFTPFVRKIPAPAYLDRFYSDRSHMLGQIPDTDFPSWPLINVEKQSTITLADYLDTDKALNDNSQRLKVTSLHELEQWLTCSPYSSPSQ